MTLYIGEKVMKNAIANPSGTAVALTSSSTPNNYLFAISIFTAATTAGPSMTDSQGQSWSLDASILDDAGGANVGVALLSCANPVGLTSSDTVTTSFTGGSHVGLAIEEFSNIRLTSPRDKVHTDQDSNDDGAGNVTTGSTTTTAQAIELVWGIFANGTKAFSSFTHGGGYTSPATSLVHNSTGGNWSFGQEFKVTAATGAQTATGTFDLNTFIFSGMVVTYRGLAEVVLPTFLPPRSVTPMLGR